MAMGFYIRYESILLSTFSLPGLMIFLIEGLLTCIIAAILFFLITDFPEQSTFLTKEEKEFIRERLRNDVGTSAIDEAVTLKDVGACLMDCNLVLSYVF